MTRGAKLIALAKNAEVVKDLEEILDDSFEDPNFSDETDTSDCQSTDGMESILSALSPNKECKVSRAPNYPLFFLINLTQLKVVRLSIRFPFLTTMINN